LAVKFGSSRGGMTLIPKSPSENNSFSANCLKNSHASLFYYACRSLRRIASSVSSYLMFLSLYVCQKISQHRWSGFSLRKVLRTIIAFERYVCLQYRSHLWMIASLTGRGTLSITF
jgi:hypothetical protein